MVKNKEDFKILSPRNHVRLRISMYAGSTSNETVDRFLNGDYTKVKYVPAVLKIIDEIIDNSIDEAIRTQFKYANKIDVSINGEEIKVTDNGRGIPQDEVVDPDGNKILRPEAAWTRVNAGTSFGEDRVSIGANGVGSSCTNFLSKTFIGKTWRDGKCVTVACDDGGLNIKTTISNKMGNGTVVTFTPDFSLFESKSLYDNDTIPVIKDRILSLSMCFPEIKFTFNGNKEFADGISNFKTYAEQFGPKGGSQFVSSSDDVSFLIAGSEDGFRQNSYINGVNTRQGGAYIDFVMNGIVDDLSAMVKRKYKVEVSKSTIKGGMTFVLFARNFVNPKYDSQTKERLTNTMTQVRDHFQKSFKYDFKYIAKKIMEMEDVIGPIVEAQLNKKLAEQKRDSEIEQKKLKKVKVAKHIAASSQNATLFLVEGDSALGFAIKVRNPDTAGFFPLRGVTLNAWTENSATVLKNKEFGELIAILGLDINDKNSYKKMNYQNVAILSDADHDGEKIATLILAFFYKFWPGLVDEGRLKLTRTPIMISTDGKNTKWFYSYESANEFKNDSKGYKHRYIKGLASLTEKEYHEVINKPTLDTLAVSDPALLEMMFGNDADARKEFMFK